MFHQFSHLWMGTEDSYYAAQTGVQKYEAAIAARNYNDDDEDGDKSPLLEVVDGVGIITVSGSMVDARLGMWAGIFGVVGYGDIQEAMVQAVSDVNVRSIMLVMKSGGGSVNGVMETGNLIRNVDAVKPVITYSPSTMASAALWLGSSGRKMYASEGALVGSIGTLMVLMSRHRMLKEDGIDAVVIRSGKYKALGHPAEPISEEAVAKYTEQADYYADMFISYVADRRGVSKQAAAARFGEGREFIGEQAKAVGLVDDVLDYSLAFTRTKATAPADNRAKLVVASVTDTQIGADNSQQLKGNQNMPHIPTPEELAAMAAAGVALQSEEATQQAAAGAQAAGGTDTPAGGTDDVDTETDSAVQALQASVDTLTAELATAKAGAEALTAEFTGKLEAAQAEIADLQGLADIARNAVRTMTVAMNGDTAAVASLDVRQLAARHKELSAEFTKKFKAGGVAATKTVETEDKTVAAVNPLFIVAAQANQRK